MYSRLVKEFKSLFEKNNWPCAPPYTHSEIIKFEEINNIILPDQLRFYLTNISSVIIKFSYPTLFCIYQEYLDIDDIVNRPYMCPVHPAFANLEVDTDCIKRYNQLTCHAAYYLRTNTAPTWFVTNPEWSAPYTSDLTNVVTYNGIQDRECDGCHEPIKIGEYFYSEEIHYDETYADYCEKCCNPNDKEFLRQKSVLLTEQDDYDIRGNGTMIIGERGCGLTTNIVLNGPFRGYVVGRFMYIDEKEYHFVTPTLFNSFGIIEIRNHKLKQENESSEKIIRDESNDA
jgi:hypothetical protein